MASFKYYISLISSIILLAFLTLMTACSHAPRKLTCPPFPHYSKDFERQLMNERIKANNTEPRTDKTLEDYGKYRKACRDFGR